MVRRISKESIRVNMVGPNWQTLLVHTWRHVYDFNRVKGYFRNCESTEKSNYIGNGHIH